MCRFLICLCVCFPMMFFPRHAGAEEPPRLLTEFATSPRQWTGIAVSRLERVFVNFPRWSPDVPFSVGEIAADGTVTPYPDSPVNRWKEGDDPRTHFVCIQSVYVDDADRLWILDPASPMIRGVVPGGPKLIRVDLATDSIVATYPFDSTIAPYTSYLNDVRVDTRTETAFITDSGLGAIVVLDLASGAARRLLADHPSTKAENITVTIGGKPFPIRVHSDGIALDARAGCLYYQALTGTTLYRIRTDALLDKALTAAELGDRVERFATSGVSDGLLFGPGGIYISSIEDGSIKLAGPNGTVSTLVKDERIEWPDSFSPGPGGTVWFTTSQIHLGPQPPTPYRILVLRPGEHGGERE